MKYETHHESWPSGRAKSTVCYGSNSLINFIGSNISWCQLFFLILNRNICFHGTTFKCTLSPISNSRGRFI